MKLASLKGGRDGRLVVVSNDLAWFTDATHIAPSLKAALEDWERCEPDLRGLAESLEHGAVPKERFHEHDAESPLPRALDGPQAFREPRAPISVAAGGDREVRGGVAVVAGDGDGAVRLVMLQLGDPEGKAFSPVAVTPDALEGWRDGRLTGRLELELNGRPVKPEADQTFDLAGLAAEVRRAGSIVADDGPARSVLKAGDTARLEMRDHRRHTIFGAIEHRTAPA